MARWRRGVAAVTAIFLPISEIVALGPSVLVEAETAAGKAISATSELPITEMIAETKVGKLRSCKVFGGVIKAVFEVWDRIAIEKLRHGVYHGLTLVGLADGRDFTVERCALTDTATALAKSGSSAADTLYIDGVVKMSVFDTIRAMAETSTTRREQPLYVGASLGANNDAALAMIKAELAQQRASGAVVHGHPAIALRLGGMIGSNHPALTKSGRGDALDRFLTRGREQRGIYSKGGPAALELDPRRGR